MAATVHTSAKFGTIDPDRIDELRRQGVLIHDEVDEDTLNANLSEPQYGEQPVGRLNDSEAKVFYEMFETTNTLERLSREQIGNALTKVGNQIKSAENAKNWHEGLQEIGPDFDTEAAAQEFFRLESRHRMLHGMFHFALGERFQAHDWRLGVRKGLRVVKVARRY